jgi:hypothetical protein
MDPPGTERELNHRAAHRPTREGTVATAFGLDIRSRLRLSFLEGAHAVKTGRTLEIEQHANDVVSLGWPDSVRLVCDQRDLEGEVLFRIEEHAEAGYRVWGPGHGAHLLSRDGRRLGCDPADSPQGAWQRLVIAQALPFAALLQGLEVFHASAVSHNGQAIATVGPSGAGKTSVALELCRLGAEFLADDVLALEIDGERLLAHPGTQLAGLDHAEAERLAGAGVPRLEPVVVVNERERLVRMSGALGPAPLAALFFLDRRPDGPEQPRFEPVPDAQWLLSATFNFVLSTPERLQRLLEVCALAARCRVERIHAGPSASATDLAQAIARRLDGAT